MYNPTAQEGRTMTKLIALSLIFLTFVSHAQLLKITRFEASDYETFSLEDLLLMLGDAKNYVPQYNCNGKSEEDLFNPPVREAAQGASLIVHAIDSDEVFTYKEGKFYDKNSAHVSLIRDTFIRKLAAALLRLEKLPSSAKLLRLLEKSYFPITIAKGGNRFDPRTPGGSTWSGMKMAQAVSILKTGRMSPGGPIFSDIGSGGFVRWDPKAKISSIESDGVSRKAEPLVALAHELYHAFDSIRGLLDMGNVDMKGHEFKSVLEYRAVYFENLVRKELGLKYRKYYTSPSKDNSVAGEIPGSMLGEDGNPIFVPAVCL